jgi:hypothetical protein
VKELKKYTYIGCTQRGEAANLELKITNYESRRILLKKHNVLSACSTDLKENETFKVGSAEPLPIFWVKTLYFYSFFLLSAFHPWASVAEFSSFLVPARPG